MPNIGNIEPVRLGRARYLRREFCLQACAPLHDDVIHGDGYYTQFCILPRKFAMA
jgi:hypothetical protein